MAINWKEIAKQVGDLNPDGSEKGSGTISGQRALEVIIGEENIRDAVNYWTLQEPGAFTAEMVLKIIGSTIAIERCYEIYKTEPGTQRADSAIFLLSGMADYRALPWVREFLEDSSEGIRWHGLMILERILYGPLNDEGITVAKALLGKAESDSNPRMSGRAMKVRLHLASDPSFRHLNIL
jgi:hypothetical protein